MTADLLPCPFCGKSGEVDEAQSRIHDFNVMWHAGCSNDQCIAYCLTDGFETKADAATAWNTRPKPDTVAISRGDLEEVRKAFSDIIVDDWDQRPKHLKIMRWIAAQEALSILETALKGE